MEIKCRVSGLNENESRAAAVADSTGIFYETGKLLLNSYIGGPRIHQLGNLATSTNMLSNFEKVSL